MYKLPEDLLSPASKAYWPVLSDSARLSPAALLLRLPACSVPPLFSVFLKASLFLLSAFSRPECGEDASPSSDALLLRRQGMVLLLKAVRPGFLPVHPERRVPWQGRTPVQPGFAPVYEDTVPVPASDVSLHPGTVCTLHEKRSVSRTALPVSGFPPPNSSIALPTQEIQKVLFSLFQVSAS